MVVAPNQRPLERQDQRWVFGSWCKNDKNKRASWEQVCKTWYKWQQQHPVLKWLDADEECTKLDQSGLVGTFFESRDQETINEYLQECIYRAEERFKRI